MTRDRSTGGKNQTVLDRSRLVKSLTAVYMALLALTFLSLVMGLSFS